MPFSRKAAALSAAVFALSASFLGARALAQGVGATGQPVIAAPQTVALPAIAPHFSRPAGPQARNPPVPALQVSPSTDMSWSAPPFLVIPFTYAVSTNGGSAPFSITGVPSWLTGSVTSGTATTSPTNVTFEINYATAIGLPQGTYSATIYFTNMATGEGSQTRTATLTMVSSGTNPPQVSRTWVSGLGNDSNPCSRTQPCLTFAYAYAATLPGGEIDVLDPGDFGPLTITHALTIDGRGMGSVLFSGTSGITVDAGASDQVTLRNLSLNGASSGYEGVIFDSGASLRLENVTVMGAASGSYGLWFRPAGASQLAAIDSTFSNNGSYGVFVDLLTSQGSADISLNRVRINGNAGYGLAAGGGSGPLNVELSNSEVAGNEAAGIAAQSFAGSVIVLVKRSAVVQNGGYGLAGGGASTYILADDSTIEGNYAAAGGSGTYTYQTNVTNGNFGSNGGFSSTLPLQ